LRVEFADLTPYFTALRVEEDEGGGEFKAIGRGQFPPGLLLNVQADDVDAFSDADFVIEFCFERVDDGLNLGAGNSVGGLKLEQDGRARADHFLHRPRIVHEGRLARMQNDPGCDQAGGDHGEGKVIVPFGFVRKQDESGNGDQPDGKE
jgi:hypothetical protein